MIQNLSYLFVAIFIAVGLLSQPATAQQQGLPTSKSPQDQALPDVNSKPSPNDPMGAITREKPVKLTESTQSWLEAEVTVNPASAALKKALWLQLANLDKCWVRNFKKGETFSAAIDVKVDGEGKLFVDSVTPGPAQDCIKSAWNNKNLGVQGRPAQARLQIRNGGSEKTGKAGVWLDWLGTPSSKPAK